MPSVYDYDGHQISINRWESKINPRNNGTNPFGNLTDYLHLFIWNIKIGILSHNDVMNSSCFEIRIT